MIKMKIFLSSPFLAENVNFLVQQTIFSLFFNFLEFCMSRAAKEAPHFIQRLSTCPEKNLKKFQDTFFQFGPNIKTSIGFPPPFMMKGAAFLTSSQTRTLSSIIFKSLTANDFSPLF